MSDINKYRPFIENQYLDDFIQMLESIPLPVLYVDKSETIRVINQAYASVLNYKREDYINKSIYTMVPNTRIPIVLQTGEAEIAWTHKLLNIDKEAIVHRIPVKDHGEVVGCFAMVLFNSIEEVYDVLRKNNKLEEELKYYKKQLQNLHSAKYNLQSIIGNSKEIVYCKDMIKKYARSQSTVLITGESGVGKELFAHAVHYESKRKEFPFITVNCAAIPENLLESELFGYDEGAFSGAKIGGKPGKIELANNGSLFLDEIGDMPLTMQAKILRVLQEKEYDRIGGKTSIPVNVRIIAATNKNIEEMVSRKTFRTDLYYRLNNLNILIPPLRDRKEDIPLLVKYIASHLFIELGMNKVISDEVVAVLSEYCWPGNVRELKSAMEKMLIKCESSILTKQDIPLYITKKLESLQNSPNNMRLDNILSQTEREIILKVLQDTNNNKSETCRILNIPRPRLLRKIRLYKLGDLTEQI